MKKWLLIGLIIACAGLAAALYFKVREPDLSAYQGLVNPTTGSMGPRTMLVVEVTGDPAKTAGPALSLLFKAWYRIPGAGRLEAPRARWPRSLDTPRAQWVGRFALPVSERVAEPPALAVPPGMRLLLERWDYGQVAMILHRGSYSDEEPTVTRLKDFIAREGLVIVGDHEEEYLKGPGMLFAGDPKTYQTIIRYRVKRP